MANYEYRCAACGHRFERVAVIGSAPVRPKCPECGKRGKRVFGPPMVQFKGSGFHVNDYGRPTVGGSE